ncbi:MAG: hypothetical protein JWN48_2001 [Myxococcaceae bacterium]|nr:hypothetical protein [Myxococcaceae bacterium]
MQNQDMKHKYRAEIERLDQEQRELDKLWTQVPWFALAALLAPVVGYVWGWGAAVVELLVSAALVGTRAYLIAMRKTENRWNREKLVDDLNALPEEPAPSPSTRAPRRVRAA